MHRVLHSLAGISRDHPTDAPLQTYLRAFWPLAAPFLILFCAPRVELALAAACWSGLILPGVLAVHLLFAQEHPLGGGLGKLAIASLGGLLLFGVVSLPANLLHWRLPAALAVYGTLYVGCLFALVACLLRRARVGHAKPNDSAVLDLPFDVPRWMGLVGLIGVMLVLSGVWLATAEFPDTQARGVAERTHWWHGVLLGAVGSIAAAVAAIAGLRRPTPARQSVRTPRGETSSRDRSGLPAASGGWLTIFLWVGIAALTWQMMVTSHRLRPAAADAPRMSHRPWNSDDVSYVSQAVDCRYGLPMGKLESSIGGDRRLGRTDLSPLVAPLVATISRVSGVECAALHHSVLPPLIVLIGVSALAALLTVILRGHRWAVPLGLLAVLAVLTKSWEYERSMTEFTIWRAMQTKSVHLWLLHPLQLASLVLLWRVPTGRHLSVCAAAAVVGHLIHPVATVLGAVWCATACAGAVVWRRNALLTLLVLLMCYGALGAEFYSGTRKGGDGRGISSGRVSGEPEQSRDLLRVDDQPIARQDPRILFGWNVVFCFGAVAVPVVLAMGWRYRELRLLGLLGVVAVACCNVEFLGRLLHVALPTSVMWRARWLLPSLAGIAVVAVALYWAIAILIRRGDGKMSPLRSFAASLAVVGGFAIMLSQTGAYAAKPGPRPEQLSKFSSDLHGLVDKLGGVEADPFLLGPWAVTRELPQLMPNIRLVLSRRKIMLPADDPKFREVVLHTRDVFFNPAQRFRGGKVPPDDYLHSVLKRFTTIYPIDHFVLDYSTGRGNQVAGVLKAAGWEAVGRSGIYEVWRRPR